MELDILHKSSGEFIVEFYGAFFIESCVYYCMEYMDAGSLDKLYGTGVPEDVLAKIAISVSHPTLRICVNNSVVELIMYEIDGERFKVP